MGRAGAINLPDSRLGASPMVGNRANNLDAATVKAKSLFDTLDMPQKPDGLRILDQVKREVFVWKPDDHNA
jgi:hypothetical protein